MASTLYDIPAATAALKELYSGQVVQNLVYKDNPYIAMVPKKTDFYGKSYPVPIQIGVSQGRSSTFSAAQTNISAPVLNEFQVTRRRDYSIGQLDNETMLASASDMGSFVKGAKVVVDSAIRSLKNSMASSAFRSGTGSIAQLGSIAAGVITLLNIADVVQFELNMTLQANATDGGTPRAAQGWVIAVDRVLGTVTVSATGLGGAAGSPAAWAASDFLLQSGDNNAKLIGLGGWLPQTVAGGDNFFGVNRSTDRVRLAGIFTDQSAVSVEEAQIFASQLAGREGGSPGIGIVSFASFTALQAALGSKVTYADYKGPANIAFRGITVNGATGPIDIFPDRNCPSLTEWLLQMDTWSLASLGEAPQILQYEDGALMMRVSGADAMELRTGLYGNFTCNAPGWNAQVKLSA